MSDGNVYELRADRTNRLGQPLPFIPKNDADGTLKGHGIEVGSLLGDGTADVETIS